MANPEHLAILGQGVEAWNQWRRENPRVNPLLAGANLNRMFLAGADFQRADLAGTRLAGAVLQNANLTLANLPKSDMRKAILANCNLDNASLVAANLESAVLLGTHIHRSYMNQANIGKADLNGTDIFDVDLTDTNWKQAKFYHTLLRHVRLQGADMADAEMFGVTFVDCNLDEVTGLGTVRHTGPSSIGFETLVNSMGKISPIFLRGCGVPDILIEYAASLFGKPFDFYSCFISYSTKDQEFAERLHVDLQAKGVRCWFFPEDAKWGGTVWGEIDRGIKTYDKLVVVCSQNSLQSPAVLREIERALQREDKEKNPVLFPIRIDDYIFDGWEHERKADVVKKVAGDFTKWKDHDAYQKAFDRLLRDLKAAKAPPPATANA